VLNPSAPQLRTADALIEKFEQIQDGLERDTITPKKAEQMSQTLKGIISIEKLGVQYLSMIQRLGRKAPVPRTPVLRNLLGLPPALSPTDGAAVRALVGETKTDDE
jgi:hypothetical protein